MTKPRGTAAAFASAVLVLGWSRYALGRAFGVHEKQIRRWEEGHDVPDAVMDWMTAVTAWLAANPPPRRPFEDPPKPRQARAPHRLKRRGQPSSEGGGRP